MQILFCRDPPNAFLGVEQFGNQNSKMQAQKKTLLFSKKKILFLSLFVLTTTDRAFAVQAVQSSQIDWTLK